MFGVSYYMIPPTLPIVNECCKIHGYCDHVMTSVRTGHLVCKKCRGFAVTKRVRKVKQLLINVFGGKCAICGYNKCNRALHFHHIDPKTKLFNLAERPSIKYEVLAREALKCILLCANCHFEVESGVSIVPVDWVAPIINFDKKVPKPKKCGRYGPKLFLRKVVRPPLDVIEASVKEFGYCATGRQYGVSDNAIRKWIKWYKAGVEA